MSLDTIDIDVESKQDTKTTLESKAHNLMVKGRSLNTGNNFNQEAFDLLSKAIKLDPHLIEAWIGLTKCYQKKSDIEGAIACLENAMKYCDSQKPNKLILRKLSTCIRQKTCDSQGAKIAALLRSLELSKQALKSDMFDGENYYNLAKAYMCLFFVTECVDRQLINLSRAAYKKALSLSDEQSRIKLKVDNVNAFKKHDLEQTECAYDSDDEGKPFIEQSDFLFNYATVLVYLQEFQKALEYLRLAIELEPKWKEPKLLEECLVDYLRQIHSMMAELTKSSKKIMKRYSKIIETLKDTQEIETMIHADQRRLANAQDIKIKAITLNHLENCYNSSKASDCAETKSTAPSTSDSGTVNLLHLKLINTINYNQAMYLTFIAIDKDYSLSVVTIYNLAASRCPTPKDIVTLIDPKIENIAVENVSATARDASFSFKRLNVKELRELYVNGHRISTDQVSKPQFRVSVLP